MQPTIGRIVLYRSRTGAYVVPAIITVTQQTLAPAGVDLYEKTKRADLASGAVDLQASGVPPLSSEWHVHLTVFSPGLPGNEPLAGLDANAGGTLREWNVAPAALLLGHLDPLQGLPAISTDRKVLDAKGVVSFVPNEYLGDDPEALCDHAPGTWAWPARSTEEMLELPGYVRAM